MRVLTYNIRHGKGMDNKLSLNRIAETIAATKAGLIGLQEVDRFWSERSDWEDQIQYLADQLRMHYVYLPTLDYDPVEEGGNRRQYGLAVLSQYPVLETVERHLPSGQEQRGMLKVTIDVFANKPVHLFNTHLGLNSEERKTQVSEIMKVVSEQSVGPSIILGDFNADQQSDEMQEISAAYREVLSNQPGTKTFPSDQPRKKLDHIFYTEGLALQHAQAIQTLASDHLPIVAQFELE